MFVNGDLKGKFIMDRNLGARDTKRAVDAVGVLQYQFGRKDPFATDGSTTYGTNAYQGSGGEDEKWTLVNSSGTTTVATAVNNPMIIYSPGSGQNWCEAVDSVTYLWQDYEQDADGGGKSIFDPSPQGWKVPHIDTWSNFDADAMTDWNDGSIDGQYGRSYPLADDKFAYYPAYGDRHAYAGNYEAPTTLCLYRSSTPATTLTGRVLVITASSAYITDVGFARGRAQNIRPVQHNE